MSAIGGTSLQPFRKAGENAVPWAQQVPHAQSIAIPQTSREPSAMRGTEGATEEALDEGRVRARRAFATTAVEPPAMDPKDPKRSESRGTLGYKLDMLDFYQWGEDIGRGANGVVRAVHHISSGKEYACKTIPKVLGDDASAEKKAGHLAAITKEVTVLQKLRSCLNVAKLIDVYEDATHVHIISEWCKGGALTETAGVTHYSERTVASYMRGVLKTLAQCHANNILHRDVKPGNFLLLSKDPGAPIKAIDFGLAEMFLSPESISSKWSPAADMWAAGVMAYQLLSGRMPFDDRRNPHNPALTAVLRSILTDKLDFNRACFAEISDEAKDFVRALVNRDPAKRLTARQALSHPWLSGDVSDRKKGKPLNLNVIQRIQRYGRSSLLKRTVFEMIVCEVMDDVSPSGPDNCLLDSKARAVIDCPTSSAVSTVLKYLNLVKHQSVDRTTVAAGLQNMGYRVTDGELERLMEVMGDDAEQLTKHSVIASQMDWHHLQTNQTAHWVGLARRAFETLDADGDGLVDVDAMVRSLQHRLPAHEVEAAYRDAMKHAGGDSRAPERMDFASFMALMRMPSQESLDLYDDRLEGSVRSFADCASPPLTSLHGSLHYSCKSTPINCSSQHRGLASHNVGSWRSSCGGSLASLSSLDNNNGTCHSTSHGAGLLLPTVYEKDKH